MRAIGDVLAVLPEKLRITATLFYIRDLTYREISEALDVPITTVESRLHKARKKLREETIQMAEKIAKKKRSKTDVVPEMEPTVEIDSSILKRVESIFADAIKADASDIHIEPMGDHPRIRYRISGVLQEVDAPAKD